VPDFPTDLVERAALLRREIVRARIQLADPELSPAKSAELWQVVDCWEGCLRMLAGDFLQELERVDREIETALRR
jgi:hypothetical protein